MTKKFKKLMSCLLIMAMVFSIMPNMPMQANAASTDKAMMMGTSGIGVWDKDNAPANLDTTDKIVMGTSGGNPVPWVMIDKPDANTGLMLSEHVLGQTKFESDGWGYYPNSTLNTVMSGYYDSTLGLTATEKALINNTTLTKESMGDGSTYISSGTINDLVDQKFFPLSKEEVETYVGATTSLGKGFTHIDGSTWVPLWWLRSSSYDNDAFSVWDIGNLDIDHVDFRDGGVRPAYSLNLSSVLFTSAAEGGKSSGGVASELVEVSTTAPTDWKMTVKDSGHTLTTAEATLALTADSTVTVNYAGASTGHTLSAMVINRTTNEIISYGNVVNSTTETGSASVTLPSGFDNTAHKLVMFTETLNGDNNTDLASEMVEVAESPSTETDITAFEIANQVGETAIDETEHTVEITMPYGTVVTALAPTITLSEGATVSPASGGTTNFTNPVTYTVTAEDGTTTQAWTVTVNVQPDPDIATANTAKDNVENAGYTNPSNESDYADETALENYVKDLVQTAVNDSSVTVTVNKVSYTAEVDGTKENPNGTAGSYEFTITVSKGTQSETTTQKTITIPAKAYGTYAVIDGNNQTPTVGYDGTITFRTEGNLSDFVDLYLNDELVDASKYTTASGSVIFTLKADYVKTLPVGSHTFVAEFTDGEATVNMEVKAKEVPPTPSETDTDSPQTGDNSNIMLLVVLMLISLGGIGFIVFKRKMVK